MKLGWTRLIGGVLFLFGGGLLWLISDHIFLDVGERSSAAGEAIAAALGMALPGLMIMIFGDRLWRLFSNKSDRKPDLAIIVVGIALVVVVPLAVLNWVALFGHEPRPAAVADAEGLAAPVIRLPDNLLEEAEVQRREAELAVRRAVETTSDKEPSNAAKPQPR